MRIAFLNPQANFDPEDRYWTEHPDFGGQLVYVKEVAIALGRMGHQVDIVTRRIVDPEWAGFEATLDGYPGEDNVRIVRLPCGGGRFLRKEDLWPYLGTEWVPRIVAFYTAEGRQPDLATTHYGDGGLAGALWRASGGPAFTFTGHSLGAQKLDRLLDKGDATLAELDAHYRFSQRITAERVAMNHAQCIITSTEQERREQYGHPAYKGAVYPTDDKFAVVPPGVNLRIFGADVEGPQDSHIADYLETILARDIEAQRRGLPAILCSSRLDPKKNHAGLVRAFAQTDELQAAANLLIVVRGAQDIHSRRYLTETEGAVLDEIVEVCERHDLWGKVSVFSLDSQQELASAYRALSHRSSVFALTALYEPFGLAPLEAMAAGLPAVVTQNGGPSESLYDRETGHEFGVLVDPTDPQDIAEGLLRLVGPAGEWKTFQDAGRRRVLDRYTWEQTAAGYLRALEEMLAAHLPIPAYFRDPKPENEASLGSLASIWPSGKQAQGLGREAC
jgi:sucrose-phosphate synthase